MMLDRIIIDLSLNSDALLLVLFISFLIGLIMGFATSRINCEGRKKGFTRKCAGEDDQELDRQMYEEYKEAEKSKLLYPKDDVEHHASKKFR